MWSLVSLMFRGLLARVGCLSLGGGWQPSQPISPSPSFVNVHPLLPSLTACPIPCRRPRVHKDPSGGQLPGV